MNAPLSLTQKADLYIALCRPGERMVAGKPYVFNEGVLLDHLAECAKRDAPDDLRTLNDNQLRALTYHAIRLGWLSNGEDDLSERIAVERARRGQDSMGGPL